MTSGVNMMILPSNHCRDRYA